MIEEFESGAKFEPIQKKASKMTYSETQKMNFKVQSKSEIKFIQNDYS